MSALRLAQLLVELSGAKQHIAQTLSNLGRVQRLSAHRLVGKGQVTSEGGDTFFAVANRWHENRKTALNAAHADRVWSRMERDVFPYIGQRPIQEITAPEVLEMIRRIEPRGALDISRRAKQGVGQVFQFAIA